MDLAGKAARKLAHRSSRRQFFQFLGAGALGAGLWLTRTDVSLGAVLRSTGPSCNPCTAGTPVCDNIGSPCRPCQQFGGCPAGCTAEYEWWCCLTGPEPRCRQRCSDCVCPPAPGYPCHCFTTLASPCQPTKNSSGQPCSCPPVAAPGLAIAGG